MFQALARRLLLLAVLDALVWIPASAQPYYEARHYEQVYSACRGSTSQPTAYRGFLPPQAGSAVYPGVLRINPPDLTWSNFVQAAQETPKVEYTITSVSLEKNTPEVVSYFKQTPVPATHVTQSGDSNIRLVWPLLYEIPGTVWALTISYVTPVPYDDDGLGPNPATTQHKEMWIYHLDTDISRISTLLELFHTIPFGTSGVPLISSEPLYAQLQQYLPKAQQAWEEGDTVTGAEFLTNIQLAIMDSVTADYPLSPGPDGPDKGIVYSVENPAADKLLSDVEFILQSTG